MKKILNLVILLVSLFSLLSCNSNNGKSNKSFFNNSPSVKDVTSSKVSYNGNSNNDGSVVGTWNEYREDGDDYLLSSFTFHSDGSGEFKVSGTRNTQRHPFTWSLSGQNLYVHYENGQTTTLSYNRGLIVEHSGMGEIVFKKR